MVTGFGNVELLMILKRVKGVVEKKPDWLGFGRRWEEKKSRNSKERELFSECLLKEKQRIEIVAGEARGYV